MGYVGNQQAEGFVQRPTKQDLTGATGTSLTLTHAVSKEEDIDLYINNVKQEPTTAYTVADTAVTLTGSVVASDDIYVVYNSLALQTVVPPDGSVTAAKLADTYQSSVSVALIADEKAYNVDGGSSSAGWNDRDLNTESFDPDNIVSISSNQFTLGAGTYIIEFSCPSYMSAQNKSQLYDVTNSVEVADSISVYAQQSTFVGTVASGCARVSITGNTTYKLRHYISTAKASNGLGVALGVSSTGNNVYSQVKITKLA